jgi:hypothetical protein
MDRFCHEMLCCKLYFNHEITDIVQILNYLKHVSSVFSATCLITTDGLLQVCWLVFGRNLVEFRLVFGNYVKRSFTVLLELSIRLQMQ